MEVDRRSELPRRAFLGVGLREEGRGLVVTRVVDGSMAARAAVEVGDVLVAVDGIAVASIHEARGAARGVGATCSLTLCRDGREREVRTERLPFPTESFAGASLELGSVSVDGTRLRTLTTVPERDTPRFAAVLFLAGVRCEPIEHPLTPDAPIARIVRELSDAGLVTMRVERYGIGDSEGTPCAEIGFSQEHAAYRAGLEALRAHPRVDGGAVFVYGHSVGGMHAGSMAAHDAAFGVPPPAPPANGSGAIRGVIVYGTTAERWSACLRDGIERQLALRGVARAQIDAELAGFDATFPGARYDRSEAFHRELDAVDLTDAWRRVEAPTLILAGEHDWVVGLDAQRALAALPANGRLAFLDGLDHAFGRHASLADSLRNYGTGAFDARLVDAPVRFVRAVLQGEKF